MVVIRFVWFLYRVMKKFVCAHKINVIKTHNFIFSFIS